jgi:hypothetical protein
MYKLVANTRFKLLAVKKQVLKQIKKVQKVI